MQAAVNEPSIFRGAVALAALHERAHRTPGTSHAVDDDLMTGGFAVKQYNRAIKALLDRVKRDDGRPAVDVVLMTNLLFACIEVIIFLDCCAMTDKPTSDTHLRTRDWFRIC